MILGSLMAKELLIRSLGADVLITLLSSMFDSFGSFGEFGCKLPLLLPSVLLSLITDYCDDGLIESWGDVQKVIMPLTRSLSDLHLINPKEDLRCSSSMFTFDLHILIEFMFHQCNAVSKQIETIARNSKNDGKPLTVSFKQQANDKIEKKTGHSKNSLVVGISGQTSIIWKNVKIEKPRDIQKNLW